jgi:hypothetical protein
MSERLLLESRKQLSASHVKHSRLRHSKETSRLTEQLKKLPHVLGELQRPKQFVVARMSSPLLIQQRFSNVRYNTLSVRMIIRVQSVSTKL